VSDDHPVDSAPTAPEIEGWEVKYIGDEPRLSEQMELFKEIGFEVMIKPFNADECSGCTECFVNSVKPLSVLYVRKTT
jgi:hypothetical protein